MIEITVLVLAASPLMRQFFVGWSRVLLANLDIIGLSIIVMLVHFTLNRSQKVTGPCFLILKCSEVMFIWEKPNDEKVVGSYD